MGHAMKDLVSDLDPNGPRFEESPRCIPPILEISLERVGCLVETDRHGGDEVRLG